MSGKNDEEILMYARQNAQRIDALIDSAFDLIGKSAGDDPILIVNDASLYLQGNNPERLLSLVEGLSYSNFKRLFRPQLCTVTFHRPRKAGG